MHLEKKMNLSNGRCHLCQIRDNDETMQHLFFKYPSVKKIIKEIEAIFNRSGLTANIEINELNIMLRLYGGEDLDVIFNIVMWEIWKIHFHWNSFTLLVTLIFFNFVQICVQSILPP
jgi:hypothetical protein